MNSYKKSLMAMLMAFSLVTMPVVYAEDSFEQETRGETILRSVSGGISGVLCAGVCWGVVSALGGMRGGDLDGIEGVMAAAFFKGVLNLGEEAIISSLYPRKVDWSKENYTNAKATFAAFCLALCYMGYADSVAANIAQAAAEAAVIAAPAVNNWQLPNVANLQLPTP